MRTDTLPRLSSITNPYVSAAALSLVDLRDAAYDTLRGAAAEARSTGNNLPASSVSPSRMSA
jgi:hypothetical protein